MSKKSSSVRPSVRPSIHSALCQNIVLQSVRQPGSMSEYSPTVRPSVRPFIHPALSQNIILHSVCDFVGPIIRPYVHQSATLVDWTYLWPREGRIVCTIASLRLWWYCILQWCRWTVVTVVGERGVWVPSRYIHHSHHTFTITTSHIIEATMMFHLNMASTYCLHE